MKAPTEEIYAKKSTQGTLCWKVHSVGYKLQRCLWRDNTV